MKEAVLHRAEAVGTDGWVWPSLGQAVGILGGYFLLQGIFRVLISDSAELDESAQVLASQAWQWGYGSDGPLYTWLQILSFRVFGLNVLGLAVLKNALLWTAAVFTGWAAFKITRSQGIATVAMFSLLFFPQITWESQRDLTHSVLATAFAAATFLVALKVRESGAAWTYLLLGLCAGLGTLSKYSYCVFVLALVVAALPIPEWRQVFLNRRLLLSAGVFVLITGLHFRWVALSPEIAFQRAHAVVQSSQGSWFLTRARGLLSVGECVVMIGGVITAAYVIAFWRTSRARPTALAYAVGPWIVTTALIVVCIATLIVLGTGIRLKDRWFQPLTFLLAIGAALSVRDRWTRQSAGRFGWLIAVAGLAALAVLPGIPAAASVTGRPTRLNAPYSALSSSLRNEIAEETLIVGGTRWVGGNLRLRFPRHGVVSPECIYVPTPAEAPWLVVWDASKSVEPPEPLVMFVQTQRGIDLRTRPASFVGATQKYTTKKRMKLGYVTLPGTPTRERRE